MTIWEIALIVASAGATIALLLFVRHLLKTYGRDRLNDPELVRRLRDTAPYHLLEDLYARKR